MHKLLKCLAVVASVSTAFSAMAYQRNDIPSCYDYAKLTEYKTSNVDRELFVIVDQTVHLDTNMKKNVASQLANFGHPGDKVTIVTFSAMAAGEYTNVPFTGRFEKFPSSNVQDDMNAMSLRKLKRCLKSQAGAMGQAQQILKSSFNDGEQGYPATELVGTVLTIGNDLVSRSTAERKIVLLVSDMLENSATLSFYSGGRVKVPDAKVSYSKYKTQGFVGNFEQAEFHVIGAGFIHGGKNYNSTKSMIELEKFWKMVLNDANVDLKQFGKPNLLGSIH